VEAVLARAPDHALALDTKGRALRDMGRIDAAEVCHRAALGHGAADAGPLNHLGILAQARGDREAAEEWYRQAIALAPGRADLHQNLSRCLTYAPGESHLAQMRALLAAGDPGDVALAPVHFALFKAHDDMGEREAAFAHLAAGNALRKAEIGYDVRREAVRMALCRSLFEGEVAEAGGAAPFRPVFVVGLPRSGTTLVERILGQCDGVQACGELSVVSGAVGGLLRAAQARGGGLTAQDIGALREALIAGYRPYSDGSGVLVDKMPLNFRWIGFICAALPEARVVALNRDPRAVAWSLWQHSFAGRGNGFAYGMADIAAFMVLHREIMKVWQARCRDRIIGVNYARLISDPETETRALVAGCGLGWTEACLAPHKGGGAVLTASAAQVRRPIEGGRDAGWRRYEAELEPMMRALVAAGLTEGETGSEKAD